MEDIFMGGELFDQNSLDDNYTDVSALHEIDIPDVPHVTDEPILANHFASGFDAEHPMLTFAELRNAGFSGETATRIIHGIHDYSERELFHCFYESEDPHEAFLELERQKMRELIFRTDQNIKDAEDLLRRLPY